jgi:hypothetical protein
VDTLTKGLTTDYQQAIRAIKSTSLPATPRKTPLEVVVQVYLLIVKTLEKQAGIDTYLFTLWLQHEKGTGLIWQVICQPASPVLVLFASIHASPPEYLSLLLGLEVVYSTSCHVMVQQ